MLPFFKTKEEVNKFIGHVNGRAKAMLLVETPEAVRNIDSILGESGIDYIHIGLNDLHLGYRMKFMFEPLVDGTVEMLCKKIKQKSIPYGFGGIAGLEQVFCRRKTYLPNITDWALPWSSFQEAFAM